MSLDSKQLLSIAQEFGTPVYVYDGDEIVKRYNELYEFITWPKLKIHYAMKANYNFRALKALNKARSGIDAVSPGDVMLALKAGFTPDRIIYTANNVTDEEVRQVKSTGVLMNIGSLSRLEKFGKEFPGSEVCIRFNPDVVDGSHAKIMTGGDLTKFGVLLKDVDKVKAIAEKYDLKVVGLHEHTGSGLQHTESVFKSMENLMAIATPENFPELRFLDFGGGFKVPYEPGEHRVDYIEMGTEITRLFTEYCKKYGRELEMYFEPGKYIVAESGYLLVEVNTIKDNNGRYIVGCNSGFPQLIRPMFYDAYHHIVNLSNPHGKKASYDVCGNICETGDRFAEQRELPEIREGDILSLENAGAYCYAMGGHYNLRPMPPEVFVINGKPELARRGLTAEELVNLITGESK
ncbi:MAG: diaminopimelate decarboxylase [Lentisphaerae bacterium]|nr:diaminopimelate decarboxylase [Lentisphaerota bacterium]MCP4103407.1 diaminopimelate decarboxylase [Lentisphaerota bacterium]